MSKNISVWTVLDRITSEGAAAVDAEGVKALQRYARLLDRRSGKSEQVRAASADLHNWIDCLVIGAKAPGDVADEIVKACVRRIYAAADAMDFHAAGWESAEQFNAAIAARMARVARAA
jgi:hypothetical protein